MVNIYSELAQEIKKYLQVNPSIYVKRNISVMLTEKEKLYFYIYDNPVNELLKQMVSQNDSRVLYILTLCINGNVEIPSYDLRKGILEINPGNTECMVFLSEKNLYSLSAIDK